MLLTWHHLKHLFPPPPGKVILAFSSCVAAKQTPSCSLTSHVMLILSSVICSPAAPAAGGPQGGGTAFCREMAFLTSSHFPTPLQLGVPPVCSSTWGISCRGENQLRSQQRLQESRQKKSNTPQCESQRQCQVKE